MNAYQQHHIDLRTAFALTDRERELGANNGTCTREIMLWASLTALCQGENARYDVVCLYLEALTRMEVQEQPLGKKDAKAWVTFNPP